MRPTIPRKTNSHPAINLNNLIIGNNLDALVFAYVNQYPVLLNRLSPPGPLERFSPTADLSLFGLQNKEEIWKSPSGHRKVGDLKIHLWNKLKFILSISGLMLYPTPPDFIRLEEEHLKYGSKAFLQKVEFKKAFVFSHHLLEGIEYTASAQNGVVIKDWITVHAGHGHDLNYCETGDNFVKEIYFYPSKRPDVILGAKDILAISHLSENEAQDSGHSDTMARFKINKIMKDLGIRGPKNGKNPNYPEKSTQEFKYRPIKLVYKNREIIQKPSALAFEDGRLIFKHFDLEEYILKSAKKQNVFENNYLLKISHAF